MIIVGTEFIQFFLDKGAHPGCPEQLYYPWQFPDAQISQEERNINPEFYSIPAIHTLAEGVVCNGQKSMGGNLRSMCRKCPIRDEVFPEMNASNYLDKLGLR